MKNSIRHFVSHHCFIFQSLLKPYKIITGISLSLVHQKKMRLHRHMIEDGFPKYGCLQDGVPVRSAAWYNTKRHEGSLENNCIVGCFLSLTFPQKNSSIGRMTLSPEAVKRLRGPEGKKVLMKGVHYNILILGGMMDPRECFAIPIPSKSSFERHRDKLHELKEEQL